MMSARAPGAFALEVALMSAREPGASPFEMAQ